MSAEIRILEDLLIMTAIDVVLTSLGGYAGSAAPTNMVTEVDRARYALGIAVGSQKNNIALSMRKQVIRALETNQCGMIIDGLEEENLLRGTPGVNVQED